MSRCVQLVLQYDGARFSGWQRQPDERTVQGVLEEALERLCQTHIPVLGAGRTDAGVHALGQAAGVRVAEKWAPATLRRAMNAVLPEDVWVKAAFDMRDDFHARYSAVARSYRYLVGTDDDANSPFRKSRELVYAPSLDMDALRRCNRSRPHRAILPALQQHRATPARLAIVPRGKPCCGRAAPCLLHGCDASAVQRARNASNG